MNFIKFGAQNEEEDMLTGSMGKSKIHCKKEKTLCLYGPAVIEWTAMKS